MRRDITDYSFTLDKSKATKGEQVLIYEVNLVFNNDSFEEHGVWFMNHINDMVATNNFIKADICQEINLDPTNDSLLRVHKITVRYYIKSYEQLKIYLETKAKEMRSQVTERFKNNYTVHRRVFFLQKEIDFSEPSRPTL